MKHGDQKKKKKEKEKDTQEFFRSVIISVVIVRPIFTCFSRKSNTPVFVIAFLGIWTWEAQGCPLWILAF